MPDTSHLSLNAFARLMDLLAALQGEQTHTGQELADRLWITLRTLRRDIARLRDAGFSVEATPEVYGGYRLAAGSRVPPLLLTDDEAIAVAIALRGSATAPVGGLGTSAASYALAKLEQLLPTRLRHRVADLRDATVSMLRTPPPQADADTLLVLARACHEQVLAMFTYTDRTGKSKQLTVEPYRLVQTSHCWYLVARDIGQDTWRTYRVDRVTNPAITQEHFILHDPPGPERLVNEGMSVAPYPLKVTLRLPVPADQAFDYIPRTYGVIDRIDETSSQVTIGAVHERWLLQFIAGLPWDVEVLEPDSVRTALADLGTRLAAKHGV